LAQGFMVCFLACFRCPALAAVPAHLRSMAARSAYQQADLEGSRLAHETMARARSTLSQQNSGVGASQPDSVLEMAHQDSKPLGDIMKPLIFGGLDGLNTTFAVVAGACGADLALAHVLVMGFVCLFAGAFSMGLGECTSAKAEREFQLCERDRESWEMENYPEGEISEMVDIYKQKGMSEEDAQIIISTMAKYTEPFIDHMMVEELGILPPKDTDAQNDGLVMFASFATFGLVPLISFMVIRASWGTEDQEHKGTAFVVSCVLSLLAFLVLGTLAANHRKQSTFSSCLKMLFNGLISGAVAYGTGRTLNSLLM